MFAMCGMHVHNGSLMLFTCSYVTSYPVRDVDHACKGC